MSTFAVELDIYQFFIHDSKIYFVTSLAVDNTDVITSIEACQIGVMHPGTSTPSSGFHKYGPHTSFRPSTIVTLITGDA